MPSRRLQYINFFVSFFFLVTYLLTYLKFITLSVWHQDNLSEHVNGSENEAKWAKKSSERKWEKFPWAERVAGSRSGNEAVNRGQ